MAAHKGVIGALLWGGEWTDAAQFAVGAELLAASRQYLVAVGLMAHVPNDAVFGSVVDIVQGHGYLGHAQA